LLEEREYYIKGSRLCKNVSLPFNMKLGMEAKCSFSLATLALLLLSFKLSSVCATPIGFGGSGPQTRRCPSGEVFIPQTGRCMNTTAEEFDAQPSKQPSDGKKQFNFLLLFCIITAIQYSIFKCGVPFHYCLHLTKISI
jgi:hypothetical protein